MIDLHPEKCNLCNGKVIYTSNAILYGREYGSGKIYYCTKCKAYVSTHKPRPKEAMGILANAEMRKLKNECHEIFDLKWKNQSTSKKRYQARKNAYRELAKQLGIKEEECHFGYFDKDMLLASKRVLENNPYWKKGVSV